MPTILGPGAHRLSPGEFNQAFGGPVASTRSPHAAPALRSRIADRLGLPVSASNAEVFAALDKAMANRKPKTPGPSAEEALAAAQSILDDAAYRDLFGNDGTKPVASAEVDTRTDDQLYRDLFGGEK